MIVGYVIEAVLYAFIALMFVRLVFGLVQMFAREWAPTGISLVLLELVYSLTDPPIVAMRRVVPPIRIGTASFDLAYTLVLLIAIVLRSLNISYLL